MKTVSKHTRPGLLILAADIFLYSVTSQTTAQQLTPNTTSSPFGNQQDNLAFSTGTTINGQMVSLTEYYNLPEYPDGDKPLALILRRFFEPLEFYYRCTKEGSDLNPGYSSTCTFPELEGMPIRELTTLLNSSEERWKEISQAQATAVCNGVALPDRYSASVEDSLEQTEHLIATRNEELDRFLATRITEELGADGIKMLREWDRKNPVQRLTQSVMQFDLGLFYQGTNINPFENAGDSCANASLHMALSQPVRMLTFGSVKLGAPPEEDTVDAVIARMNQYQRNGDAGASAAAIEVGRSMYLADQLTDQEAWDFWRNSSNIYELQGDYSSAVEAYLKVLEHASDLNTPGARSSLAGLYKRAGKFQEALELHLQRLEEADPQVQHLDSLKANVARAYIDLNDFENARPYVMDSVDHVRSHAFKPVFGFETYTRKNFEDNITFFEIAGDYESAIRMTELLNEYDPPFM